MDLQCPRCGLFSPPTADRCDCGYDFKKRAGGAPERRLHGGSWIRFEATVVDTVALLVPTLLVSYLYRAVTPVQGEFEQALVELVDALMTISIWWVYTAVMLSSPWQGTLGKKAVGLKVVDYEGHRISFQRATGRCFAEFLSAILLLVGFFMVAWTDRRQALHDLVAKTLVVKTTSA